jgi:cytochrome c-type biogenesis protein CcmE
MGSKPKLLAGAAVITAVIAYLVYLGATSDFKYYLLVDECAAQADRLQGKRLRVSGTVGAGSLKIAEDRRSASFVLNGKEHRLAVRCSGALPDNLAEGIEVVVEGSLGPGGGLLGDRVITRCASKYAPKDGAPEAKQG